MRPPLDAGRAVADHPVELFAQFGENARDAFLRERILVARLGRRQQREVFEPLVADQRLRELRVALYHVDEIVDDAPLGAHDEIKVAQADVEIDDHDLLAALCDSGAERGGGGRLPDAALA